MIALLQRDLALSVRAGGGFVGVHGVGAGDHEVFAQQAAAVQEAEDGGDELGNAVQPGGFAEAGLFGEAGAEVGQPLFGVRFAALEIGEDLLGFRGLGAEGVAVAPAVPGAEEVLAAFGGFPVHSAVVGACLAVGLAPGVMNLGCVDEDAALVFSPFGELHGVFSFN